MTQAPDPLIGRELGGCRILERVGRGGMGAVYKAHHHRLDRVVAVKILPAALAANPQYVQGFQREARAAARIEHPRIVQIYDVASEGGIHFIVMQFVEGETLADLIGRKRRLSPIEAHTVMHALLEALAEAHRHGIVHHDVKPGNVLLGKDGTIRLADFGLALPLSISANQVGTMMGTPQYVAPEQASGFGGDARSDLYSAGATYFHMLAGQPPFEGKDSSSTVLMQVNDPLPNIRRFNPAVPRLAAAVIGKLMAKRPEDRYASAEKAIVDLDAPGVVIGELGSVPSAAEPEHWRPEVEPKYRAPWAEPAALHAPESPEDVPAELALVVDASRKRVTGAALLFLAAAAAAYLAGLEGGWLAAAASAALFLGACRLGGQGGIHAPFVIAAAGASALYGAGACRVSGSSLLDPSHRGELLLWAGVAFAFAALASYWGWPKRWRNSLWLLSAAGLAAAEYHFALPAGRASLAVFSSGPPQALGAIRWAILLVGVAVLLKIRYEDNFFGRAVAFPLLLIGGLAAYAAGALQTNPPPSASEVKRPLEAPAPVPVPIPPPAKAKVPPPSNVKDPPRSGGGVSVLEVKDEEEPAPSAPPREPPSAPDRIPLFRPRAATPSARRVDVMAEDVDPVEEWWNKSVLTEEVRAKLWEPLRPFREPGGGWRGLLPAGILLYAFGLCWFLDDENRRWTLETQG